MAYALAAVHGSEDPIALRKLKVRASTIADRLSALNMAAQWCFKNAADGLLLSEADENRVRVLVERTLAGDDEEPAESPDEQVERLIEEGRDAEAVASAIAKSLGLGDVAKSEGELKAEAHLEVWEEQARWHAAGLLLNRLLPSIQVPDPQE